MKSSIELIPELAFTIIFRISYEYFGKPGETC